MNNDTTHVYLLLDRSGSMSGRWDEAISAINAYAFDLAKSSAPTLLTLALFDGYSGLKLDVIRKNVPPSSWTAVSKLEALPRGDTPLHDAIVEFSNRIEWDAPAKAVVIVQTDGGENASRKHTQRDAKAKLDAFRAKGWQVVFLGADFDAFAQASAVGTQVHNTINMVSGAYGGVMRDLSAKTQAYGGGGGGASFVFSDADRVVAAGGKGGGATVGGGGIAIGGAGGATINWGDVAEASKGIGRGSDPNIKKAA